MGASNTKLEDDLWSGSGSISRYKSESSPKKQLSPVPPASPKKEKLHQKEAPTTVDDRGANTDPDDDIVNKDPYDPNTAGPIFPNGEINWDCPCLGGAAHGPCGTEFRDAFSCFHHRFVLISIFYNSHISRSFHSDSILTHFLFV